MESGPAGSLVRLGHERDELLHRIVEQLQGDSRVAAAWLSGSFGRGEADAWSDLDLHVAVADKQFEAFFRERHRLYEAVGHTILIQPEMLQSDSQAGARFQLVIFTGPVEVDWNIGPLGPAARPAASVILFDRIGVPIRQLPPLTLEERRTRMHDRLVFFWAMAPIAVKYVGRGDTRRAGQQIALLTTAYIALRRLLADPHGPEPFVPSINRPLEPEIDATLPVLGASIDPLSALEVIRALCDATESLHPSLGDLGVAPPTQMPDAVRHIAAIAEAELRRGHFPHRPYR
ncbi:MAG: nucleotidyltransferase domain-containing protein [Dehalococcoidia bacterium]